MNRFLWHTILGLAAFLAAAPGARAQRNPHLGYVYPAGGSRGSDIEVTVGGQYLNGVSVVHVSGEGVQAKVSDYRRPLTRKEANELRQKLRELQKRLQAARKRAGNRGKGVGPNTIKRIAQDLGLEATNMKEIAELRKKISPQNQLNPQLSETVVLQIELATDARPGVRELRLKTASGVSNPIFFHVGQWPEYREKEPNDRAADSGIPERLPVIVNGQIMPGDVDRFRFSARKGEQLVAAASARELIPYLADAVPGWFQATMALYDADGAEVAYADDYRFHPDPVLYYEIPEDGSYVLEIKDAIYRGREDFVYRIALGELPFVTSVFPLGGQAGKQTTVDVTGWNLPVRKLTVKTEEGEPGIQPICVRRDEWISNHVPFAVDTLPECLEAEPNDGPQSAQRVEVPRIVNGRIERAGDWDVFRFEARAGDEIVAEVRARRLDSPLDSLLKLTDANGRVLTANDDHEDRGAGLTTHHADSQLYVTIPADGTYCLHLGDTQHQGGLAYGYRLRISPRRPGFDLRVVPSTINARGGTTVPITVYALRRDGFAEDIALELKDAPPGFALSGGWVPAGQDKVRLTLTVPSFPQKTPWNLCLEGRAVIEGRDVRRQAVPAEDMMQAFIYRHLVPSKDWIVAVSGRGRSGAGVRLLGETPVKIRAGGTARVRIAAPRGRFANQIRLELNEPPEGIAIQKVSADRDGVAIVLRAQDGKAKPGLKGNLIVNAFMERNVTPKGGKKVNRRRVQLGTLPAIPFEIVGDVARY